VTGFGVPGQQPSPEALYKKIQATKAKGYFVEQEQTAIGMCGVSAPIILPGCEKPIASVCVATAGSRLDDAEEQILGQIARTIALRCAS
jgi:DNA-binding IclR family transcriptional regulator